MYLEHLPNRYIPIIFWNFAGLVMLRKVSNENVMYFDSVFDINILYHSYCVV